MSPAPRKPGKPKRPSPKRPPAKEVAALRRALETADQAPPPPDVAIRWSGKPPSAAALKRLGIDDRRMAELAKHLKAHGDEIANKLRDDRELAEQLATDPEAALKALGIPEELRTGGDAAAREAFLERFRGVRLDLPSIEVQPEDPPSAATLAAVQLVADTFHAAAADPGQFSALKTDPTTVVTAVAASHPPQGLAAGSAAAASVVADVTAQVAAVYGATAGSQPWRIDPGALTAGSIRIPRIPRGR